MTESVAGQVYILHFDQPFRHARHYIGWTGTDLESRLAYHAAGRGSRLLKAVIAAGITWTVVALIPGDRHLERRLKSHAATRYCTLCGGKLPRYLNETKQEAPLMD